MGRTGFILATLNVEVGNGGAQNEFGVGFLGVSHAGPGEGLDDPWGSHPMQEIL